MDTLKELSSELEHEYKTTRKFFEEYPEGKNDYAPHPKSMKLAHLVTHIATIFGWPAAILSMDKLDLSSGEQPTEVSTREELLNLLDENYKSGADALSKAKEADLDPSWKLVNGDKTLAEWTKYGAIRHGLNQIAHHRAQLGVYYRLNDIPVPGSYGPSADDKNFG